MTNRKEYVKYSLTAAVLILLFSSSGFSETGRNWAEWRGPNHNGISDETGWDPEALKRPLRVNWNINVGEGYSSVSVKGDYLYTMGYDQSSGENILYCLKVDTAEEVWRYTYEAPRGRYAGPKCTPVAHNGFVYTFGQGGWFKCNDARTGELIWKRHAVEELGARRPHWQFPSSVRVHGRKAIVNAAESGVALDRETGEVIWVSPPGTGNYATPVLYEDNGRTLAVIVGRDRLYSVDARTGETVWVYPWSTPRSITAADPFIYNGLLYISSGYRHGGALLDISGSEPELLWQNRDLCSHFTSPIIMDGHIYGVNGNAGTSANLKCLDIEDGSVVWSKELGFGNMMAAAGYIILVTENGSLYIIEADPLGYKEVSSAHNLLDRLCWTAPVLVRSTVYLRNDRGDIISIDLSRENNSENSGSGRNWRFEKYLPIRQPPAGR